MSRTILISITGDYHLGVPFEFFDHTGDIGVRLEADTLDGLFETAAYALVDIVTDRERVQEVRTDSIDLESTALDLLLVEWLSELVFRFDARGELVRTVHATVTATGARLRLSAEIRGEHVDPARHAIKVLVKSVTYHALDVARSDRGWRATVVFDI
jgi:SHS2 domain-containing protein